MITKEFEYEISFLQLIQGNRINLDQTFQYQIGQSFCEFILKMRSGKSYSEIFSIQLVDGWNYPTLAVIKVF